MSERVAIPTGRTVHFGEDEIIVSKTDLKSRITYANDVFVRVSGYTEAELIGARHSIMRHPAMPRCIYKLFWNTIESRREIFAYVLNLCKSGDEYWVFAHVTPSYDRSGAHIGYHSNRRTPHADALARVRPLYAQLLSEEKRHADRAAGLQASSALLTQMLATQGVDYDRFVFGLSASTALAAEAA